MAGNNLKSKKDLIFLSIIIPAYNEENRLRSTLDALIEYLKNQPYSSEIIVVNDGSSDGTADVVQDRKNGFNELILIDQYPNHGKGKAIKTGMMSASGEYRLFMDADYAVSIEYIPAFLALINTKYDIVIASRGLRQSQILSHQPFIREFAAKLFGVIQRIFLKLPIIDTSCGFKLYTKEAAKTLFPMLEYDCAYFDTELLYIAYKLNMQIGEIGVRWRHDQETRLPIGLKRLIELIKKLLLLKRIHCFDSKD